MRTRIIAYCGEDTETIAVAENDEELRACCEDALPVLRCPQAVDELIEKRKWADPIEDDCGYELEED
jgi:hypothetical protein